MIKAFLLFLIISIPLYAQEGDTNNLEHIKYIDNITDILEKKHYIPKEFSKSLLLSLNFDNKTIEKITAPKEALIWGRYKKIFITDERLASAKVFLKEHYDILHKIETEFKVDKEIIVSLIAIESNFGKYKPVHNVGDALFTLSRYYPPRSNFFTKELIHYVILRYLDKTYDNNSIKGSYAGAIGLPQFMPSSILNYAVDYDGDCKIDLLTNWHDVFASVANYLKMNGWVYKDIIANQVKTEHTKVFEPYINKNIVIDIEKLGYSQSQNKKATIKRFENEDSYELWITYKNYDVIKTYNRSDNYALTAFMIYQSLTQQ